MTKSDGKTFFKSLNTELSKDEVTAYGEELADNNNSLAIAENTKKAKMKEYSAIADGFQARIDLLALAISTKHEYRDVECGWEFDFGRGEKSLIRLDTGEKIKTEKVTEEDRQNSTLF